VPTLSNISDFGYLLSEGLHGYQNQNWDPAVNNDTFSEYCNNITNDTLIHRNTTLPSSEGIQEIFSLAGAADILSNGTNLTNRMLNYIGYVMLLYKSPSLLQDLL
jgi:hypothetical protein